MNDSNGNEKLGDLTKKVLYKVASKLENSDDVTLHMESGSQNGNNFMGDIFRVRFGECKDNNNLNSKSLILKVAPTSSIRREVTGARHAFLREIRMYDEVLSYFNDFQLSKGVNPKVDGFNEFPDCYSTIDVELSESIFLEDLTLRQFDLINLQRDELTFDHVSLMMKAMGKFHAISFAIKDQQPEKFMQLSDSIPEQYWTNLSTKYRKLYEYNFKYFIDCLEKEGRLDSLQKFRQVAGDDVCATILEMVSGTAAEPYAVICHGDITTNNSMFRKDEQGKSIEVQIFDWQFSRYASPITDLMVFVLCSTTKELRDKHYHEFLKIYHDNLSDLLTRLGSNPQNVFPYDVFLSQCHKYGVYAAFVGVMLINMLCTYAESLPDVDEMTEGMQSFELDKGSLNSNIKVSEQLFKKQVTELFDDMERFGYL